VLILANLPEVVVSDLLPPAVVLGILIVFPFCQLIGYKCIETEKVYVWRKWF
jgi:hypothetical protein